MRGRIVQGTLVSFGVLILVWLVVRIGPGAILTACSELSWRLVVLMVFPCVLFKCFDTLGWYFTLPANGAGFLTVAKARLIGQAVSATTPTATIGGDAAKAWVLRNEVGLSEVLSSLVIVKTTMTVSQALFLLLGVVLAQRLAAANSRILSAMQWLLVLEAIAVAGFVAVQLCGVFTSGHGLLRRTGLFDHDDVHGAAVDIDRKLSTFYRHRPGKLALSVACNLLGWVASAGETWLILVFLGIPVTAQTALVIEAFGAGIRFATFFVPAQVGFAEGGAVATFLALGLSGGAGLAFSVVRRLREVVWIGIGLLLAGSHREPALARVSAGT